MRSSLKPGKALRRRSKLKPGKKRLGRGKWAGASAKARAKLRRRERWRRTFGPEGFVAWLKSQPCERCGAAGPNEVHHEPTRGAGGTWIDTTAACKSCHRRRHRIGVKAYWKEVGRDYGEASRRVQGRWLARMCASTEAGVTGTANTFYYAP